MGSIRDRIDIEELQRRVDVLEKTVARLQSEPPKRPVGRPRKHPEDAAREVA